MDIPIVLIHKSEQPCVEFSLRSTKYYHEDVTLITDVTSGKYNHLAKIVNINDLKSEYIKTFSKIYKHFSTNSYEFEYVCIERWFLLLEYMIINNLNSVIYIDSDVIIYNNLTKIINKYYEYDICLCTPSQNYEEFTWVSSGHTMFCTYNALKDLCNFILDTYFNNINELLKKWNWHQENNLPGGINDMTLLYLFQRQSSLKVGNFLSVVNDTFCFDSQINSGMNEYIDEYEVDFSFLLDRTIKKIKLKKNVPYVYNQLKQKDIQFQTLHCQSDAKRIMPILIRDKKTFQTLFTDNFQTLKVTYSAIRKRLTDILK